MRMPDAPTSRVSHLRRRARGSSMGSALPCPLPIVPECLRRGRWYSRSGFATTRSRRAGRPPAGSRVRPLRDRTAGNGHRHRPFIAGPGKNDRTLAIGSLHIYFVRYSKRLAIPIDPPRLARDGDDRSPRTRRDDEVHPLPATGPCPGERPPDAAGAGHHRAARCAGRLLAPRHIPGRSATSLHAGGVVAARPGRRPGSAAGARGSSPLLGGILLGTTRRAGRAGRGRRRPSR